MFVAQSRSAGVAGNGSAPVERAATTNTAAGQALAAKFMPVEIGISDGQHVEIVSGLGDGVRVITTGAGALKDGDQVVSATADSGRRGGAEGTQNGSQRGSR